MDNITHSLTGLALARAGLNRLSPRATLLLLLSANIPDSDIVMLAKGQFAYFEAHRGYTHSLLFVPVLAAVCVALVAAIYRQKLPWARAWIVCLIGLASHLLLDWTNSYGIRPLIPFSSRWFHLDVNGLYDWAILIVLFTAAVWPLFGGLVSSEIGERARPIGKGSAIFALTFFVLYDAGRALMHERAIAELEARLYEGLPPIASAALPHAFSPFQWSGILETATDYRAVPVNALNQLNTESAAIYYKPAITAGLQNALATEPFRYFRYFARYPVWSIEPVTLKQGQGKRFDLTDLRFGRPGEGSFHCIALEDSNSQVLQAWFVYGSGANVGRGD